MSIYLRALPSLSLRFKPLYLKPLPLFCLNKFISNTSLPAKRSLCSGSVSAASAAVASSSSTDNLISISKQPFEDTLDWVSRTGLCGDLSQDDVGKRVRLCGWVALHRVHGGLTFLNLRDHSGIVQVTTLPDDFPDAHSVVNDSRLEYVISVEGVVRNRPTESINKKMKTGMIEFYTEATQDKHLLLD